MITIQAHSSLFYSDRVRLRVMLSPVGRELSEENGWEESKKNGCWKKKKKQRDVSEWLCNKIYIASMFLFFTGHVGFWTMERFLCFAHSDITAHKKGFPQAMAGDIQMEVRDISNELPSWCKKGSQTWKPHSFTRLLTYCMKATEKKKKLTELSYFRGCGWTGTLDT